jgi:hypothetical protein
MHTCLVMNHLKIRQQFVERFKCTYESKNTCMTKRTAVCRIYGLDSDGLSRVRPEWYGSGPLYKFPGPIREKAAMLAIGKVQSPSALPQHIILLLILRSSTFLKRTLNPHFLLLSYCKNLTSFHLKHLAGDDNGSCITKKFPLQHARAKSHAKLLTLVYNTTGHSVSRRSKVWNVAEPLAEVYEGLWVYWREST